MARQHLKAAVSSLRDLQIRHLLKIFAWDLPYHCPALNGAALGIRLEELNDSDFEVICGPVY